VDIRPGEPLLYEGDGFSRADVTRYQPPQA
jgi:uncharacterized protein with PIN domain